MKNFKNNWLKVLDVLSKETTEVGYSTWFVPITPIRIDDADNKIYLDPFSELNLNILAARYLPLLENAIYQVFKKKYTVVFEFHEEEEDSSYLGLGENFREEYYLNPRYNFGSFVVGENNKYAHAAAQAVAKTPSDAYNPLFIYGDSGLGKTHLMHAIGHYILQNHPKLKVLYVSSEMFTNELIKSIGERKTIEFRNKYRSIDVLLIDDIQFIEGKEGTQEEFFHTFNTLYEANKQIIISSDRPPNRLTNIEDRLRSRFQWNFIADIQPPDYETRVAILIKKATLENIEITNDLIDVIGYIAEKIKLNIRELEGAFTRVVGYASLVDEKINVPFAKNVLKDVLSSEETAINQENIKKMVCKHFNIKVSEMESAKRDRSISFPRQIAMYLCRDMTDLSLPKIGAAFGKRDHSTVLHACDKISTEIKSNPSIKDIVTSLKKQLKDN
ncbi:MAG: chromosomal replication initiator protein DnaA [Peptostreptococcaceae bacterium]|nr:chromosomal replication initiator protein DnaA [Peptostreptococcaceae bacterium]